MPFILSFKIQETLEKHFDTVSDALASYEQIQKSIGCSLELFDARLIRVEKNTFVDLYPGITVQEATSELESVWMWEPEDRLKIRPMLKSRYHTGV